MTNRSNQEFAARPCRPLGRRWTVVEVYPEVTWYRATCIVEADDEAAAREKYRSGVADASRQPIGDSEYPDQPTAIDVCEIPAAMTETEVAIDMDRRADGMVTYLPGWDMRPLERIAATFGPYASDEWDESTHGIIGGADAVELIMGMLPAVRDALGYDRYDAIVRDAMAGLAAEGGES
jgi:hypothetical protein